jgi:hypothetical protein
MNKPDFFIAGALKSGTTSMHNYLKQHPSIFMPAKTEIFHFATDLLPPDDTALDDDWYQSNFEDAEEGQIIGEKSAIYLLSDVAAQNVKDFNPDAKIIIILRNPVDFMFSLHAQTLYGGHEDIADFAEALAAEPERREGGRPVETGLFRVQRLNWYKYAAHFSPQVERFYDVFGKESVKVIIFDDFKNNTPQVYAETCEFLGVDSSFEPEYTVKNPRQEFRSRALRDFTRKPPSWMNTDNSRLSRFVIKRVRHWNTITVEKAVMDPDLRKRLVEEFKPEVNRLGQLLERDLSHWSK